LIFLPGRNLCGNCIGISLQNLFKSEVLKIFLAFVEVEALPEIFKPAKTLLIKMPLDVKIVIDSREDV
jgi:hypothetical protein